MEGDGETGNERSKIDLKSGFMKQIIRNQQNRDDYDKEVKMLKEQKKSNPRAAKNHARKPEQGVYVPPARGNKGPGPMSSEANVTQRNVFKLQYEDQDGEISEWLVHKGDNPVDLASRFGRQCHLSAAFIEALGSIIGDEMDKRWLTT